jgi:hypothetical protein
MRNGFRILALGATTGLATTAAMAHHGFGTFVMDEDVEITGTVTGLDFVNPHAWLYLDVKQADGTVAAFRCEMRSANTLRRSGWTPEMFPEGKEVTITGSPDRDDPYSCYVGSVIFDDGSRIDRYGQITAPLDIGQAERPLRLANGDLNISGDWATEQRVMTDPRGQFGTLVALSEADEFADDFEGAGTIGGARGTEQAAVRAEAARRVREGEFENAEEAEAAIRAENAAAAAAAGGGQGNAGPGGAGPGGRAGGPGGRGGFAGFGGGRGGGNTLTEAGQAALAAVNIGESRYATSCLFSVVSEWSGEPVNRIVQRGDTISILYSRIPGERVVHMNMDAHPEGVAPSPLGHSIGRWENDVLIVDSVGFEPGLLNARMPYSDQLHLVEQFTFNSETGELSRSYTATDATYWTGEQTGSGSTTLSDIPRYEELTIDEDAELGPRQ